MSRSKRIGVRIALSSGERPDPSPLDLGVERPAVRGLNDGTIQYNKLVTQGPLRSPQKGSSCVKVGNWQPIDGMRAAKRRVRVQRASPARDQVRSFAGVSPANRSAHWFILLAALLAFSWQSVLVQTHRHIQLSASRAVVALHDGSAKPRQSHTPSDSSANCPICRELAHATHYLAPAAIVFIAAPATIAPLGSVLSVLPAHHRRWHRWRSREPPLSLQDY